MKSYQEGRIRIRKKAKLPGLWEIAYFEKWMLMNFRMNKRDEEMMPIDKYLLAPNLCTLLSKFYRSDWIMKRLYTTKIFICINTYVYM